MEEAEERREDVEEVKEAEVVPKVGEKAEVFFQPDARLRTKEVE